MYFKVTYDQEFNDLFMYLKSKYPDRLFDLDGIGEQLDMSKFSKEFFSTKITADSSVDANANVDDNSVIAYVKELPKPFFRMNSYYMLWKELRRLYGKATANKLIEMNLSGDIYINDFHGLGSGVPYCNNYSTYDIMIKGLPMITKIKSVPPKYLYSFKSQLEQFAVIAANSTLGATGLADVFIVMSYYVDKLLETKTDAHYTFRTKEDCWNYVRENIISFIYTINQPNRSGLQSPFTNVSVYDKYFLESLKENYIFPDGSTMNIKTIQKIQEMFMDIMNQELKRTPITFPVTTACFSINGDNTLRDKDFIKVVAKYNKEYGYINLFCGKSSLLSSCCRLRSDTDKEYFNSFGAGATKIGSLGVVTMNLPRLAIKYQYDEDKFFRKLKGLVRVASQINNVKRKLVQKRIDNGNHPLYDHEFIDLSRQYSTVGVNGLNECVEIMKHNILDEDGQGFVLDIINTINEANDKFEKQYDAPHNCEQVPGENLSIKLCDKDRLLKYHDMYDIYSNQFIPLVTDADMLDRIKLQGRFDKHFSGGAICHINVDTKIDEEQKIIDLITMCAKMGVVYFAINYNLQRCEDYHMSVGKGDKCGICGKPITANYTRVVGFLTNVRNWARKRREIDYPNRKWYNGVK